MGEIFFEITVIICLAAFLTLVFRLLRQPPILAYILTGILLGPVGLLQIHNKENLATLGQLGITLLLFMLGLELKLQELRTIGRSAAIAGTLQVLVTFILGFVLAMLIGLPTTSAYYIGIAASFSSTIIIVKVLSDKKDLNSLHGKLAIGMLLVQDFFAVLTIIFLSNLQFSSGIIGQVTVLLLKVVVLFGWIIVLSKYVFPAIVHKVAKSSEVLFLFSLAWVFAFTAFVTSPLVGFSVEIGGFLAGLALANSAENFQIVARMKALRDFFITIFFVILGLEMSFQNIGDILLPAIIITLFVLLAKPIIVMAVTGLLGFHKRTSFFTGVSLAQISEFSLIILFLGRERQIIPQEIVTLGVLVALLTFLLSTYFIVHANKLYALLSGYLHFFERKHLPSNQQQNFGDAYAHHVIVVGAHQMGQSIIKALEHSGEEVVVVDFDPDIAAELRQKNLQVIFGDIADPEIQERAGIGKAKLVISTIPDIEDNLLLIGATKHTKQKVKVIVMALETMDAKQLYKAGADYVVLPHLAGGRHLAKILVDNKHLELIEEYKEKDLAAL